MAFTQRRYEFHSRLTPDEVFFRLTVYAKPLSCFAQGDKTFRYKRKMDGFFLTWTGDLPANGAIPFWGGVRAEGAGSVINGGFSVWRALWKLLAAMCAAMCLTALLFGAPPEFVLTAVLPLTALWVLLCIGGFSWAQRAFFKKRQQAVLGFIERHLLG